MEIRYVFPQLFNPDDVDIRLQYIPVIQLERMVEAGKLCIPEAEELQKMSNAWNDKERSSFIESIMANLPIQIVYLDGSKIPWTIIDGVQRISSLHKFIQNGFALGGLEYFSKECEGKLFSSIPFYLRRRIESTNIVAYVINPGTPDAVKFNIFKRINKIGKQRNREELRNAFFQDSISNSIKNLAESPEFLKATHKMVSKKGMADRELVCRYFAFRLLRPFFSTTESMDDFLDKGMDALSALFEDDLKKEMTLFKTTMGRIHVILEDIAFININSKRKFINKNLFDAFSYTMSQLNDNEYQSLCQQAGLFKKEYTRLFKGKEFLCENELRKTSKEAIHERFDKMNKFVRQFT